MPQGKSKTKVKLPANVKAKKKYALKSKLISHARKNAPVPSKASTSAKSVEAKKMMKAISKELHSNLETEIRAVAFEGKSSLLSKKEISERAAASK
ncbi:hypothetical protein ONE63_000490 [Megalurothrips usitatus]|uniref:Histone H1 n=1 Tax=Megalurothrips usitatus TaxID=439358 RepID=A0AAV7XYL4_9NEOP|nr:hypothetical protein ONE63_000490 [Megalurothrips usitatus]